jgi:hypothetical protein
VLLGSHRVGVWKNIRKWLVAFLPMIKNSDFGFEN